MLSDLALVGARIHPSPEEPPIENGSIIVHDARIVAVGSSATTKIPHDAQVIDCKDLVVMAGFWNSHVHIMTPGLLHAERLSSEQIASQLEEMFTRWGFTTVFDIASVLENTELIRRRIESGEVKGPRILTVGEPFWTKAPIYVKDFLQANHISIPEVESLAQAAERVRQQIHDGADGIKIFVGSVQANTILIMPLDLAKAIVAEAHGAGKPVFTHPGNQDGVEAPRKCRTARCSRREAHLLGEVKSPKTHGNCAISLTFVDDGQEEVEAVTSRNLGLIVRFADNAPRTWSLALSTCTCIGNLPYEDG